MNPLVRMALALSLGASSFALHGCGGCSGGTSGTGDGGDDASGDGARDGSLDGADVNPDTPPPVPGLISLRIDPESTVVTDDGVDPGETATLRALGTFEDGERDITTEVGWSLANTDLGTIDEGTFTSAGIGGVTEVTAQAGDVEATGSIRVMLNVSTSTSDVPEGGEDLFPEDTSGDTTGDGSITIVYPSHETLFPLNLVRVLHQWQANDALDLFELRFESNVVDLRVYTTTRDLPCPVRQGLRTECWLPGETAWRWLANSHAGSSVELTVRGLATASPATVYRSDPITLLFSRHNVLGALYYWSTSAKGVMRARISAAVGEKFYTDPLADDAETCVACHTVSRDGRKLAVGYGGERLREVNVPERETLIPSGGGQGPDYAWGTFSPDGEQLLYASDGILTLLDSDTGESLGEVDLPDGTANMPDWAPNGDYIAIAYDPTGDGASGSKSVRGTSLARIPVNSDGTFGTPEILVESTDSDDDTISFPVFSPDSAFIAFARGSLGGSKNNVTSVIQLVASDGSGSVIALTRLNERVRHEDGITGIGNAMPTWAPAAEADVFFLAFSSLRDYGDVLVDADRDQLWGVAIDPSLLPLGDPSFAAFWMPFQDLEEGNHRAFWALDPDEDCPSDTEICDGIDNDCDGVADDSCCTPTEEICGDDMDNDCNGVADEGCDCTPTEEICNDGIDNDCDGDTDGADFDCVG